MNKFNLQSFPIHSTGCIFFVREEKTHTHTKINMQGVYKTSVKWNKHNARERGVKCRSNQVNKHWWARPNALVKWNHDYKVTTINSIMNMSGSASYSLPWFSFGEHGWARHETQHRWNACKHNIRNQGVKHKWVVRKAQALDTNEINIPPVLVS